MSYRALSAGKMRLKRCPKSKKLQHEMLLSKNVGSNLPPWNCLRKNEFAALQARPLGGLSPPQDPQNWQFYKLNLWGATGPPPDIKIAGLQAKSMGPKTNRLRFPDAKLSISNHYVCQQMAGHWRTPN